MTKLSKQERDFLLEMLERTRKSADASFMGRVRVDTLEAKVYECQILYKCEHFL